MSELEWVKDEHCGTGDGRCVSFSGQLWHIPIEPGSLSLSVLDRTPLVQLAAAADDQSAGDGSGSIDLSTGLFHAYWCVPPDKDDLMVASYQWRPPKYRDCSVVIRTKDGALLDIPLAELKDALNR